MNIAEIRERNDEELMTLADHLRDDIYRCRVRKATNQLDDTGTLGRLRGDLARVLTVQRSREIGIEEAKPAAE